MIVSSDAVSLLCIIQRIIFYPIDWRCAGLNLQCWVSGCLALLPAAPSQTICAIGNDLVSGTHEIHRQQCEMCNQLVDNIFFVCYLFSLTTYTHFSILLYISVVYIITLYNIHWSALNSLLCRLRFYWCYCGMILPWCFKYFPTSWRAV